ncbi:hypothetical protein POTOM_024911 [Populus tomentosa]|uniref:Uncharacterized protein n=1 Tax=Populus tomentosa TaxID=118781 RepID=A0A8X7ZH75_POPTO|nr:hypothetical protein POTOM_024911 [Populus tomentosa]
MVPQFSTFNESSYEGNPLLCGPSLPKSCTEVVPPSPLPRTQTDEKEDNGFIEIEAFYVIFSVSYILVLLVIDNLPVSVRFKGFQPCVQNGIGFMCILFGVYISKS